MRPGRGTVQGAAGLLLSWTTFHRPISMTTALTPTSVHEAAHAVISIVLGIPVRWVRVQPKPGCLVAAPTDGDDLTKWITQALAAQEAERIILGCADPAAYAGDDQNVEALLDELFERTGRLRLPDTFRARARQLVVQHRALIESVAVVLERMGSIPGDGIEAVVRAAGDADDSDDEIEEEDAGAKPPSVVDERGRHVPKRKRDPADLFDLRPDFD